MTRTVVHGGLVFDGTGTPPARADLTFEDGTIVAVGADLDGDIVIDAAGATILPGFIDCHLHVGLVDVDFKAAHERPFAERYFRIAHNLATTLDTGITTARDAGGVSLGVKTAVEAGLVRGPRLKIALAMISQTGGHGDGWLPSGIDPGSPWAEPGIPHAVVDSPDDMRRVVRQLVRAGADCIKVATSGGVLSPRDDPRHAHLSPDELDVLVAEATAAGITSLAHAQGTNGIRNAVAAGITSIEHGIYLDEATIEMMLERGTRLVPTLLAPQGVIDAVERGVHVPEYALRKARDVVETHRASIRMAIEAGVEVAFGTDCPVSPHGTNLQEFALMHELGMTPESVLAAATSVAARLVGVDDRAGTLREGLDADFVIVDGDATDFTDLRSRIKAVYQAGVHTGGPDFHGRLTTA